MTLRGASCARVLTVCHSPVHDTFLVLNWMFPKSSPPVTVISTNSYYDPQLHVAIGAAVRPLRFEDILVIGTGGAVHNLYRNAWSNIILYRDNFAQTKPPQQWALDFRNEALDAFTKNTVNLPFLSFFTLWRRCSLYLISGTCSAACSYATDAAPALPRCAWNGRPLRAVPLRRWSSRRRRRRRDQEHFARRGLGTRADVQREYGTPCTKSRLKG